MVSSEALPTGTIGDLTIGRLICGGNLIGGWAHSRDLLYASRLFKAYNTEEKIMDTLELCEEHGVNTIVTNVPGPQFPLYMLGARMLAMIPQVPLIENIGLGIALMSYDGTVFWGFTADYDLVPDLEHFVDLISKSFEDLADAAGAEVSKRSEREAPARAALLPGGAQPSVQPG